MCRRRVVVTGLGAVSPLGTTVMSTWEALLAGGVGVRSVRDVPEYLPVSVAHDGPRAAKLRDLPCAVAAPVRDDGRFKATARETRANRMLLHAAAEALNDSKLSTSTGSDTAAGVPLNRVGVCVGVGMPSIQDVTDIAAQLYHAPDDAVAYNRVGPFFVTKILGNTGAGAIALKYGFRGPNACPMTACATGAHSIGDAARWIRCGEADAVVCGATEACITPVGIAGFCRMKALATKFNGTPEHASRPFDKSRCGFVMGEGAGVLVLEELEGALRRNARIYAEVRGIGASCDAFHVSSPHPEGLGARECVQRALSDADLRPNEIAYVNAHATGTPMGDEIEAAALADVLRPQTQDCHRDTASSPLLVSSTKGAVGHLLGAAGAVEAIFSLLALHHGLAPPTANLTDPIDHNTHQLHFVRGAPLQLPSSAKAVLSTSFGFGGTNAALVFGKL